MHLWFAISKLRYEHKNIHNKKREGVGWSNFRMSKHLIQFCPTAGWNVFYKFLAFWRFVQLLEFQPGQLIESL